VLIESTVKLFLDQAASSSPTPGGGSVSSLVGALGVGLLSMVCNLTLGKEKYRDVEDDIRALLAECESLRNQLTDLIEADVTAYGELNTALKLPKGTEEEKALRTAAVQNALVSATNVPLEIAVNCRKGIELSAKVAEKGNRLAISDVGVGVLLCESALFSALLNVDINLKLIKDAALVADVKRAVEECTAGASQRKNEVMATVQSLMA
jgi:formiminotetrahydrofolate cyclodeaminase